MIEDEKLKDIREESVRVVGGYGDSWSSGYVRGRAAITLELLDEIERLKKLAKTAPFKVGDVVRAVGDEEPTGTIDMIKQTNDEYSTGYVVKLFKPNGWMGFITYYEDEIELIERPEK